MTLFSGESIPITVEQLRELTKPPIVAVLATVNPDGTPQATPLWYDFDGAFFNVTAFTHRVKVRNIPSNPAVSLVIVDTTGTGEPFTAIGRAELVEEGAHDKTRSLAIRYLGEERGAESAARLAHSPRVIIRISPQRLLVGQEGHRVNWP